MNVVNATSIAFHISLLTAPNWQDVGICGGSSSMSGKGGTNFSPAGTSSVQDGMLSKTSKNFGIPVVGQLRHNDSYNLPSRHLGLVQAFENQALETFLRQFSIQTS